MIEKPVPFTLLLMYQTLDITKISTTIERLQQRIHDRFPESGLLQVARELHTFSEESAARSEFISRPQPLLRIAVGIVIVIAALLLIYGITQVTITRTAFDLDEWVQMTEAALNATVLIGAGIFFLVTMENRIKRHRELQSLHQLRSIAHVIDMHQLTKDPASITKDFGTPASPQRTMTTFELNRYLDYCSELLSLTGQLAAVFSQSINDREVIASANEIESLTTNLARKVWQKIANL